jgi:hypothetical protein
MAALIIGILIGFKECFSSVCIGKCLNYNCSFFPSFWKCETEVWPIVIIFDHCFSVKGLLMYKWANSVAGACKLCTVCSKVKLFHDESKSLKNKFQKTGIMEWKHV